MLAFVAERLATGLIELPLDRAELAAHLAVTVSAVMDGDPYECEPPGCPRVRGVGRPDSDPLWAELLAASEFCAAKRQVSSATQHIGPPDTTKAIGLGDIVRMKRKAWPYLELAVLLLAVFLAAWIGTRDLIAAVGGVLVAALVGTIFILVWSKIVR